MDEQGHERADEGGPEAPAWSPRYGLADRLLMRFDGWVRGCATVGRDAADPQDRRGSHRGAAPRAYPGEGTAEAALSPEERRRAAGMMRVNHAGEVAAQALYEGQALVARQPGVRETLQSAAREEADHLEWCRRRLGELGAAPSLLDPLWYAGAFTIGALAGARDDATSLGFVAETERQVVDHLGGHLARLPPQDRRSRAVLEEMARDEARHGTRALAAGGRRLPLPVRLAMRVAAGVMTRTAYWL